MFRVWSSFLLLFSVVLGCYYFIQRSREGTVIAYQPSVCLSVCLTIRVSVSLGYLEKLLMDLSPINVNLRPTTNRLDFGIDLDLDLDLDAPCPSVLPPLHVTLFLNSGNPP